MNFLLFISILIISFIIVRIGAVAFEMTGLNWSLAKFQSLSCFTGTGFTTRESELITTHVQRRQIASALMILGNAGLVTLIATFANSLRSYGEREQAFVIPVFGKFVPSYLASGVNLLTLLLIFILVLKLFTQTSLSRQLSEQIRRHLVKKQIIKTASFEEMTLLSEGYGVTSVEICPDSPVLNKSILEAELRSRDITVLAIERKGRILPNPTAARKILLDDKLICFGKLENIHSLLCVNS